MITKLNNIQEASDQTNAANTESTISCKTWLIPEKNPDYECELGESIQKQASIAIAGLELFLLKFPHNLCHFRPFSETFSALLPSNLFCQLTDIFIRNDLEIKLWFPTIAKTHAYIILSSVIFRHMI